jgi:hypothetical protein
MPVLKEATACLRYNSPRFSDSLDLKRVRPWSPLVPRTRGTERSDGRKGRPRLKTG